MVDNGDFCENVIIVGGESEANMISERKRRSSERTDFQLQKLVSFMTINPDFTQGQADEKLLLAWDSLTAELNSIGPPMHSSIGWRKIWSDHKANQKRKRSPVKLTFSPSENVVNTDPSGAQKLDYLTNHSNHEDNGSLHLLYKGIFDKLDVIVEQQSQTNSLLKKLVEIFDIQTANNDD